MTKLLAHIWRFLHLPKKIQLFIMRFVNDEFLVGVTGVIVNDNYEVLILKHTYRQTPWSLPGGFLKGGEHPMEGLKREVLEETGLTVQIEKIIKTSNDPETARLDITCFGGLVNGTFKASAEVSDFGFFAYDKLPEISKRQKALIKRTLKAEKGYTPPKQLSFDKLFSFIRSTLRGKIS